MPLSPQLPRHRIVDTAPVKTHYVRRPREKYFILIRWLYHPQSHCFSNHLGGSIRKKNWRRPISTFLEFLMGTQLWISMSDVKSQFLDKHTLKPSYLIISAKKYGFNRSTPTFPCSIQDFVDEIRIFGYFWCFNHHGFDGLAPQAAALQGTYDLTPKAR